MFTNVLCVISILLIFICLQIIFYPIYLDWNFQILKEPLNMLVQFFITTQTIKILLYGSKATYFATWIILFKYLIENVDKSKIVMLQNNQKLVMVKTKLLKKNNENNKKLYFLNYYRKNSAIIKIIYYLFISQLFPIFPILWAKFKRKLETLKMVLFERVQKYLNQQPWFSIFFFNFNKPNKLANERLSAWLLRNYFPSFFKKLEWYFGMDFSFIHFMIKNELLNLIEINNNAVTFIFR